MASITKRGPYQFQAQIRRKGYPLQNKTFETKKDAEQWARVVESEMDRGVFVDRSELERTTLKELLERYANEITLNKRAYRAELNRIKQLQRHPLAERSLASLRAVDFSSYRDKRLHSVSPRTVQLELAIFSHMFNIARKEWSLPVTNFVKSITKPSVPPGRERRLEGREEERLLVAAKDGFVRTPFLAFCIQLAIETGMRAGEIVSLQWGQIDLANHVIHLRLTKNGDSRTVPLSVAAENLIRSLPRPMHGGRVTTFHDSNGLGSSFRAACVRAGIENLHFHDLRHEAASRLASHMPVATLAKVMGWKTLQMAMRYYNPKPAELVEAVRAAA